MTFSSNRSLRLKLFSVLSSVISMFIIIIIIIIIIMIVMVFPGLNHLYTLKKLN